MNRGVVCFALAGLVLPGSGCNALSQRPAIQSVTPRISGIDLQGLDLVFDVDVLNPYPIPLKTPSFRYGLDIAGSTLFETEAPTALDLPAGRIGKASLPVRIDYLDLFRSVASISQAPEVDYTLRGALLLSALGQEHELPLSHRGTMPVIRPPRFSVTSLDFSEVSLNSAKILADVTLDNPNVFPIGVSGLGYHLRLGDVDVGSLLASSLGTVAARDTGTVSLGGEITARRALMQLVAGQPLGDARLSAEGSIDTPYGPLNLSR